MTTQPLKLVAPVLLVLTVGLAGCMSDDDTASGTQTTETTHMDMDGMATTTSSPADDCASRSTGSCRSTRRSPWSQRRRA